MSSESLALSLSVCPFFKLMSSSSLSTLAQFLLLIYLCESPHSLPLCSFDVSVFVWMSIGFIRLCHLVYQQRLHHISKQWILLFRKRKKNRLILLDISLICDWNLLWHGLFWVWILNNWSAAELCWLAKLNSEKGAHFFFFFFVHFENFVVPTVIYQ